MVDACGEKSWTILCLGYTDYCESNALFLKNTNDL